MSRRARHNPINPVGWTFLVLGGAAVVGVGVYLATRPAAAATPPPPPGGGSTDSISNQLATHHLTAADLAPSGPALTKNVYVPPPFVFGAITPAPYNPTNKNLGDPNDQNSPAYACIQSYNMLHRGTPLNKREQYVAAVWGTKCVNAGGKADW
jgi:hypothetical protein